MAIKLRLAFRELRSTSALKAFVVGALLAGASIGEFRALPAFVFAAAALGLYLVPLFRTLRLLPSFTVLLAASLLAAVRFAGTAAAFPLAALSAFLFAILIRLKDFSFVFRERWHHLFVLGLGYLAFLAAAPPLAGRFATLRLLVIVLAVAVLLAQFFDEQRILWSGGVRHRNVVAYAIALITGEMIWLGSVLPLSEANAAGLGLITLFAATDLAVRSQKGELNQQVIIRQSLIAGILLIIILATTRWTI